MKPSETLTVAGAPVMIGRDEATFVKIVRDMADDASVHLICDTNTVKFCLETLPLLRTFINNPIVIASGEEYKTIETCKAVWSSLADQGAGRHSVVINLGGGVVTDLGGFCAATYLRGVRFVHVPTTLLGMCDAALGGKLGVDFLGLKNYVGLIQQPEFIWVNPRFVETLPERQFTNGMAEVIKHALIGDPSLFQWLEEHERVQDLDSLIIDAIMVKKHFVDADVNESGIRAALNFGHTFGHALESLMIGRNTPVPHGECVAVGMLFETWLASVHLGTPGRDVCRRISNVIRQWLSVEMPGHVDINELLPLMAKDKKGRMGHLAFSLIGDIGVPRLEGSVPFEIVYGLTLDPEVKAMLPWLTHSGSVR